MFAVFGYVRKIFAQRKNPFQRPRQDKGPKAIPSFAYTYLLVPMHKHKFEVR